MKSSRRLLWMMILIVSLFVVLGCELTSIGQRAAVTPTATPIVIVVTATPEPRISTPTPKAEAVATPLSVAPTVIVSGTGLGRDAREDLLVSIYERVSPSVVFIQTEAVLESFFGRRTQSGSGSGFVIDKAGHIVTNYHVIEGASRIDVKLSDKTTARATVVGSDPTNDLAVLKVDVVAEKLHPVELGSSTGLKVGQLTIAIGSPLGLEQSMSSGIVSALGRQIERSVMEQSLYDVIQTDAAINPGNSGGPLLDSQGKVIGVNTAIANLTGGSIGIGFAVPVDTVKKIVPVLIQRGRYPHPWLGITGYALTPGFAELLRLPVNKGVLVMDLDLGGPADKAGVRGPNRQVIIRNMRIPVGGDIIVAVDGNAVENMDQLLRYLDTRTQVGQEVTLSIVRDGGNLDIKVRLEELPDG